MVWAFCSLILHFFCGFTAYVVVRALCSHDSYLSIISLQSQLSGLPAPMTALEKNLPPVMAPC